MRDLKVKIFHSFEEAQKDFENDVFSLAPEERVSVTEHLRRQYYEIKNKPLDLDVKKVVSIIKGR